MRKLAIVLILFLISCSSVQKPEANKLLLVSFDGFRADYLSKTDTPNFDELIQNGVTSKGLIPVFPSMTFPNYYAIATGLYPESSGFIHNTMYDEQIAERFTMGNREQVENPAWYGGEPIWNTVEKSGLNAGTMFWVGSEAPIQNMRPTYWKPYDGRMPNSRRVDSVLKWMSLDSEKDAEFGTLYFSFVDSQGHRHGPESVEVTQAIQEADSLVGYLISQMKEKGLWDSTNLMIVSDHGMTDVSPERLLVLDDFINPEDVEFISYSPVMMMNPKEGKLEDVYTALKEGAEEHPFSVYKKEELPERFHLKNHSRTSQLVLVTEPGWTINTREFIESHENYPSGGAHGFDNQTPEMHALFVASGPDFKKNLEVPAFENIHLYSLMAYLLDLDPAHTDGSLDSVKVMLK